MMVRRNGNGGLFVEICNYNQSLYLAVILRVRVVYELIAVLLYTQAYHHNTSRT